MPGEDKTKELKTNELHEIIKKSASEEIISSGTEKSGEELLKAINKGVRKGELSILQARIAKEVPKALMQSGKALGKFFKITTLIDICSHKEDLRQKIITDTPRLAPGGWGILGEVWNYKADEYIKNIDKQAILNYFEARKAEIRELRQYIDDLPLIRLENQYKQLLEKIDNLVKAGPGHGAEIDKAFEQLEELDKQIEGLKKQSKSGSGGGGGSPTGGAAPITDDQRYEQLKNDSSLQKGHYDPSMMTESQHSEYLKNEFKNSSTTDDQLFERLKDQFEKGEGLDSLITRREEKVTAEIFQGDTFYDPVTEQVTPNVTQRVLNKNGIPMSDKINTPSETSLPGVASQPFNREKPFSTPNASTIKNTLYGGVKLGYSYAKGFLRDRSRELMFGKKLSKIMGKADAYRNYANMAKGLAKTFAKSQWKAASTAVKAFANAAWQSVANTVVGQAIGSAVAWAGAQLAAMWGALTALPFIGGAIAAVGAAVSWAIGLAISFLFPW
ncbi:MAG TPA: hypothetical protein P5556_01045 [Candidatus Gastranaerophilales bacterium]|nr:hypothetical protein [Candidatus Gastranaerophilales bacterium]